MRKILVLLTFISVTTAIVYLKGQSGTERYSVVISEIYPDPTPVVLLPDEEFIEILNLSEQPVSLAGWAVIINDKRAVIDSGWIEPGEYVILSHINHADRFSRYGKVIGVPKMPALKNSGATVVLKNKDGQTMHAVTYSPDVYESEYKKEGGWSLELIDPESACIQDGNWKESEYYMGGTPGAVNSVSGQPLLTEWPEILNIGLEADTSLTIYFSQTMDSSHVVTKSAYDFEGLNENKLKLECIAPFFNEVHVISSQKPEQGMAYSITMQPSLKNCLGDELNTTMDFTYALPEEIQYGDIIINEIMYDPENEETEFMEILNRSEKYFLLNTLWLGKKDDEDYDLEDSCLFFHKPYIMKPGGIYAVTSGKEMLCETYTYNSKSAIIENKDLFSLNNSGKCLLLQDSTGNISDYVCYSQEEHNMLLYNPEGVSLERVSLNNTSGSWSSASGIIGGATPGMENSQLVTSGEMDVDVSPLLITPDEDGTDDVLTVSFRNVNPGYVAEIKIFDSAGKQIKEVLQNTIIAENDSVVWNGQSENDETVPTGLYIVYIEVFNPEGNVKVFKEGFAVNSGR
jgi:hypothetical protein